MNLQAAYIIGQPCPAPYHFGRLAFDDNAYTREQAKPAQQMIPMGNGQWIQLAPGVIINGQ